MRRSTTPPADDSTTDGATSGGRNRAADRVAGGSLRWRGPFGRLWGSVAVSMMGTQVSLLALPLTALAALDATAGQVALLAAAGTAPFLVLGLPAGAWVDRWPRRTVMVIADVARAALLASIPAAWALGVLTLTQLYLVAFAVGSVSVLFDVASLSALPSLVPAQQIAAANGRLEAARAVAQTSGPGLGGVLVQVLSAPLAVTVDAVSYLASAALLRGLPAEPARQPASHREPLLRQVTAGLAFCLRHPYIRPLAVGAAWLNLSVEAFLAILLTWAVRELGLSAATVGIVLAASNVGYLLGSLLVPRLNALLGVGRSIAVGAALQVGFVVATLAHSGLAALWLTAGLAMSAAGVAIWNVNAVSLRQATTPEAMLARMNASNRFLIWGTMPIGAALGGCLASSAGLNAAAVVTAVAAPLSAVPVLLSAVLSVRAMPEGATRGTETGSCDLVGSTAAAGCAANAPAEAAA
ncbi:MAG: MFS transporter [Actinomycetes bacterium]